MKILIAEDEKDLRKLLTDQLTEAGYEVLQAEDGRAALELFNSASPDIAILDIMMPVMDGLSLLTKIRETSEEETSWIRSAVSDWERMIIW